MSAMWRRLWTTVDDDDYDDDASEATLFFFFSGPADRCVKFLHSVRSLDVCFGRGINESG
jgi:hypothetical protein